MRFPVRVRVFVTAVVHGSEIVQLSSLGKMGPRPADAFSSTNPTSAVGAGSQDLLVLELQNTYVEHMSVFWFQRYSAFTTPAVPTTVPIALADLKMDGVHTRCVYWCMLL